MSSSQTGTRGILEDGLSALRRNVSALQLDALTELAELLARWSTTINLTGHRTVEDIAGRLILDACGLESVLPDVASLADIGSGAGFPGLPVAILRPGCRVTLIESRERRNHFQRAAIRELGLQNVQALLGRAEELSPFPHTAAIAQAVTASDALPLLERWVDVGGLMLFPGSQEPPPAPAGVRFETTTSYTVPSTPVRERTLSIARRS